MIFAIMLGITVVVVATAFGVWLYFDMKAESERQARADAAWNAFVGGLIRQSVQVAAQFENRIPLMITRDMHQQLADLGYQRAEREDMTPEQAHAILQDRVLRGR